MSINHFLNRYSLCILFFFFNTILAQNDSLGLSPELEQYIEDATIQSGLTDADWNVIYETLNQLKQNPIDLNKASEDALRLLPWLTDFHIHNILFYRKRYGPFVSIYELQAVPGMTKELFTKIRPYVIVRPLGETDIREKAHFKRGPTITQALLNGKGQVVFRISSQKEKEEGFLRQELPDSLRKNYFLGPPIATYGRFIYRYHSNLSIGVVWEQDRGEPWKWQPEKNQFGPDFVSFHLSIGNYGRLKRLVFGDYYIEAGQGLVLSRGLGFGKSALTITAPKSRAVGLKPYTSVNEFAFLRGSALTFYLTPTLSVTPFLSAKNIDASLNLQSDTLVTAEETIFFSISNSGYHRTPSEIAKRKSIYETIGGILAQYETTRFQLGTIFFHQQFSATMKRGSSPYQYYDFEGNQNQLSSLFWEYRLWNFTSFGEIATSRYQSIAASMGIMGSLDPKLDVSFLFRYFSPNFHSFYGYTFAERPYQPQNEIGVYTGIEIRPHKRWRLNAFIDFYRFPWYTYRRSNSINGKEFFLQTTYILSKEVQAYIRWRFEEKPEDLAQHFEKLKIPQNSSRSYLRFHLMIAKHRKLSYQARIEWSFIHKDTLYQGVLFYQDLRWQFSQTFSLSTRYTLFDTDDYESRIYAFEHQLPYRYFVPAFYGKGSKVYFLAHWKFAKHFALWIRIAQLFYYDRNTISSGLSEIRDNKKTEYSFQVHYIFP